jgi:Chemoreceptor zinc-binding domain
MAITQQDLDNAILAHAKWKNRLRTAIETGESEFTPGNVSPDNQCDFGKWLYSLSPEEKKSNHWNNVKELHAHLHKVASQTLANALSGNKQLALDALAANGEYTQVTSKLTKGVMEWKKVV